MKILFLVNELLVVCGVTKYFFHLLAGLKEYYPQNEYYVITGGGNAVADFRNLGIPIYINENILHEKRSVKKFIAGIIDINNFVNKEKIDIIHSHHHYAGNIANYVSKIGRVKTVFTNHGIIPKLGKLSYFPSQTIIAVNEHARLYIENNSKAKKIIVIRCGIKQQRKDCLKRRKIKVIVASRLVKDKGVATFIKAIALLPKKNIKIANFYIAGEGKEIENLKFLAKKLKARVIFLGQIKKIQELLCHTHILVNPTHSKTEGFPTILIEAGLQKNLIISSDFCGNSHILEHNRNSLIYPKKSSDKLAKLLVQAIENYHKFENLREMCYRQFSDKFDYKKMINSHIDIYEEINEQ